MSTDRGLTPSQTVGPYLGIGLLLGDLITADVVAPSDPRAITIGGTLFDGAGAPVPDGMIEIWQANAAGRYFHPADQRDTLPVETGFHGFGRSGTADAGRFAFTTVKPGRVPWPGGGMQAPHILVGVFARGLLKRVATRLYFPDEVEANAADPLLAQIDPAARESLVAVAHDDGSLRFDIRLQGKGRTTFFAV
jgi:protocatechuate 3,4-dioxygenase alpha subunit